MKPWSANLFAAGVAGAVLAGGLVVGAPDAEANAPAQPASLAPPPMVDNGRGEIPLGETMEIWGRPAKLNLFWTSDTATQVADTYADAWKAAGLKAEIKTLDRVTGVSAVDPATHLMRLVTIMDSGEDRLVMPGIMDAHFGPDLTPARAPVPIPENLGNYVAHVADDTTAVTYTGTYTVPMSPRSVMGFYQREMGGLGYTVHGEETKLKDTGLQTAFERGPEHIQITATFTHGDQAKPVDERKSSLVMITHTRQLGSSPEGSTP